MTYLASVQIVEFVDAFGEVFETHAFTFDGDWVIKFEENLWMLEHDIHPLRRKPAGYFVEFTVSPNGAVTNVEIQNLQQYNY